MPSSARRVVVVNVACDPQQQLYRAEPADSRDRDHLLRVIRHFISNGRLMSVDGGDGGDGGDGLTFRLGTIADHPALRGASGNERRGPLKRWLENHCNSEQI